MVAENPSGRYLFHTPVVNMTNSTTSTYSVEWTVRFDERCFGSADPERENSTTGVREDGWERDGRAAWRSRRSEFSTWGGGQFPNIEIAAGKCQDSLSSDIMHIIDILEDKGRCPVYNTSTMMSDYGCNYRGVASQLAEDVSKIALERSNCTKGDWQSKTPCEPEDNMAVARVCRSGLRWVTSLISLVLLAARGFIP